MVPIHRHVAKDECFVVLRGKVRVTTVLWDVVLSRESGCYGVDISKGVWHMVDSTLKCNALKRDSITLLS